MPIQIVLGGNSTGQSVGSTIAAFAGEFPSPDPRLGPFTCFPVVDGYSCNATAKRVGEGFVGDGSMVGFKTFGTGGLSKQEDFDALKAYIRKVKSSFVTIPFIAVFMRHTAWPDGEDPHAFTPTARWSARDLGKTMLIELDGFNA